MPENNTLTIEKMAFNDWLSIQQNLSISKNSCPKMILVELEPNTYLIKYLNY
jgi:hypothetical protein